MNYCSHCGQPVTSRVPEGDNRHRFVCDHCDRIHYQNPRIIAGTIPVWDGRILMCRRAIQPRYGYWTLPAGFMENGETTVEAARRETLEEAMAGVLIEGLYTIMHVTHIDQVHMFFRATLLDGHFGAGEESLEARLFSPGELPWDEMAFPTVQESLEHFITDSKNQTFPVRVTDIQRRLGQ